MPFYDYYALGPGHDANTLTLIEDITSTPSTMRSPGRRVPLLGPLGRETLDYGIQYNGRKDAALYMGKLLRTELDALVAATTGDWETAYANVTVVGRDESWRWGTWNAIARLPRDLSDRTPDYELLVEGHSIDVLLPLVNCQRSLLSVNGATTLTVAQRYVKANTTSAGFTLKLPSAADVSNLVITVIKTAAANTLTIQRADATSDTVEGNTSIALTGLAHAELWIGDDANWERIT